MIGNLVIVPKYDGLLSKSYLQCSSRVSMAVQCPHPPWSHDHISGTWQPAHLYNCGAHELLWSCDCRMLQLIISSRQLQMSAIIWLQKKRPGGDWLLINFLGTNDFYVFYFSLHEIVSMVQSEYRCISRQHLVEI